MSTALAFALEPLQPICPTCGRLVDRPETRFRDWPAADRVGWHVVVCVCGCQVMAKFYRVQSCV